MKRRTFSLILTLSLLLGVTAQAADTYKPTLGLQTWTCRNMDFDQMVAFAVKHKLKYIQPFSKHINPMGTKEETLAKKAVLDKHGLVCYTFGVTRTYKEKAQNRKLFEFAKLMGIKVIVVEPGDLSQWDVLEELVKEYDIKLAIHNHGINSTYGSPAKVWKVIRNRDKRIGVCMDVGHITGAGFDAAKAFVEYEGRVYDIHLKDKKVEKVGDKNVLIDAKVGTGDSNYTGLFKELRKAKWDGVLAIETDNGTFARNPTDFVVAAIEYVKKTTDVAGRVVFILPLLAGAACVAPPTPVVDASALFQESFDQRQTLPSAFTPVNGTATVVATENGRHLELPAAPKSEHGVLFGPAMAEGFRVGARFRAAAGERDEATFAVGLSGLDGYRLRVNPERQQLELCRDTAVVQTVPFQSVPGQWTHLRLQVRALPGLQWAVQGKAWDESQQEPEAWTLEWTDTAKPELGQAAVWGTPLGGEPVAVDDIGLWLIEP